MSYLDRCVATANSGALRQRWITALATVGLAFASSAARSTVAYNEGTSGDLSNSGLSPTMVSFSPGDNIISGTSGKNSAGVVDRDYFTFTLAPNEYLTALDVLQGTVPIGFSFIGIESGNQVTLDPSTKSAAGLLGWMHYSASNVGTDILGQMSVPADGSSGFTRPLGPGTYAVWVQEASSGTATYAFDFRVASVPEPASWTVMILGFGFVGLLVRRTRRKAATAPARA